MQPNAHMTSSLTIPGYVPTVAALVLKQHLGGTKEHSHGLLNQLHQANERFAKLPKGAAERSELGSTIGFIEWRISLTTRLAVDPRMKDAYPILSQQFQDDADWYFFLDAALTPIHSYSHYRNELKQTKAIRTKMLKHARALEVGMRDLAQIAGARDGVFNFGINWPERLFWLEDIISRHNIKEEARLTSLQDQILEAAGISTIEPRDVSAKLSEIDDLMIDFPAREPASIADALLKSSAVNHSLARLHVTRLDTITDLVGLLERWNPELISFVGAAAKSQKPSKRTEVIRLLGHGVGTDRKGQNRRAPTTQLARAISIVANVLINDPNDDVTPEDVRKALSQGKGTRNISRQSAKERS
jgi:hypothetical protein